MKLRDIDMDSISYMFNCKNIIAKYPELYETIIIPFKTEKMLSHRSEKYKFCDDIEKFIYARYMYMTSMQKSENIICAEIKELKFDPLTESNILNINKSVEEYIHPILDRWSNEAFCISIKKLREFLTEFTLFYPIPIMNIIMMKIDMGKYDASQVVFYPRYKIDRYNQDPRMIIRRRTVSEIMELLKDYPYDVVLVGLTKTDDYGNEYDIEEIKKWVICDVAKINLI